MGAPYGTELGLQKLENTFTAISTSNAFPINSRQPMNVAFTGGVGTVQLEKTYDGGLNWCAIYAGGSQLYVWSLTGSKITESVEESEAGVLYRLNCTAWTSNIPYRLSQ